MPYPTIAHLVMTVSGEFTKNVFNRLVLKRPAAAGALACLSEESRKDFCAMVIEEHMSSSPLPTRQANPLRVLWAGCYFKDCGSPKEAYDFATALSSRKSNLPVYIIDSKVKAAWHGRFSVAEGIGETEDSELVGTD